MKQNRKTKRAKAKADERQLLLALRISQLTHSLLGAAYIATQLVKWLHGIL